jgi:hypothetical protein
MGADDGQELRRAGVVGRPELILRDVEAAAEAFFNRALV